MKKNRKTKIEQRRLSLYLPKAPQEAAKEANLKLAWTS